MHIDRILRASAFVAILAASPAIAQEVGPQEHHSGAAAETIAPPAPRPAPTGSEPGPAMGQGGMMVAPGSGGDHGMTMMRECMGMMGRMMQGMPQGEAGVALPDDPVAGAFAAINRRMHRDMAVPTGAKPDVAFAQAMIAHHQGAIDMARVILGFGSDPEIRTLAQEVITAQQGEITFLQQWLARQP